MTKRAGAPFSWGGPSTLSDGHDIFRAVFEQAGDAMILADGDGRIVAANPAALELTGYSSDEILGMPVLDTYLPEMRDLGRQRMIPTPDGVPLRFERDLLRKDRTTVPIDVATTWLASGQRLSIFRDVSARNAAEEARRLDEARLQAVFALSQMDAPSLDALLDSLLDQIVALTRSKYGYIYYYDEATETFTLHAWSKGVMADCAIAEPRRVYALADIGLWGEPVRQRTPVVVNDFIGPHPLKRGLPPGHARLIRFMTVPVWGRGSIVAVAGVANKSTDYTESDVKQLNELMDAAWRVAERQKAEDDLRVMAEELEARVEERTRDLAASKRELEEVNAELSAANKALHEIFREQEQLHGELAYRALHDPLTGLANRAMFQERLDYAFRTSKRGIGVLWIDLDRFKAVNDIFGHDVGDEMLIAVADRLREVLRDSDDIARLGGDEFAVVLPNVIEEEARAVGDRVLSALVNRDAFRLQIGASVGVAWQCPDDQDKYVLLRRADEAMYKAKSRGGNQAAAA